MSHTLSLLVKMSQRSLLDLLNLVSLTSQMRLLAKSFFHDFLISASPGDVVLVILENSGSAPLTVQLAQPFPTPLVLCWCGQLLPEAQTRPKPTCYLANNAQTLMGVGVGSKLTRVLLSRNQTFWRNAMAKPSFPWNSLLPPFSWTENMTLRNETSLTSFFEGGRSKSNILQRTILSIFKWSYGVRIFPKILVCCCLGIFPWSPLNYLVWRVLNRIAPFANNHAIKWT